VLKDSGITYKKGSVRWGFWKQFSLCLIRVVFVRDLSAFCEQIFVQ
jgi:hypothetical protein